MSLQLQGHVSLSVYRNIDGFDHAAVYSKSSRLFVAHISNDAIGDPGVIDLFETDSLHRIDTIFTEKGAHTIGFDSTRNKIYAFLPESHRAAVYLDK